MTCGRFAQLQVPGDPACHAGPGKRGKLRKQGTVLALGSWSVLSCKLKLREQARPTIVQALCVGIDECQVLQVQLWILAELILIFGLLVLIFLCLF